MSTKNLESGSINPFNQASTPSLKTGSSLNTFYKTKTGFNSTGKEFMQSGT